MSVTEPVLKIENLSIPLPLHGDRRYAVEDLSMEIRPGEILCVVGESGSGKSVTSFSTMGLLPRILKPSRGRIIFAGRDLLALPERERRRLRGSQMAMIFQEPMSALNPCYTVGEQIDEVIRQHRDMPAAKRKERVLELLQEVRLPDPENLRMAYPHQLSGGQRQRIVIAMALALDPKLLIADEPTTALDVTTQAQILKLIKELKSKHHAGILFITHDFGVVAEIADRIVVMQHGRIVEQGPAEHVLYRPRHSYTQSLIQAVPRRPEETASRDETKPPAVIVQKVSKTFQSAATLFRKTRVVQAVKEVDFTVREGETLGIVGESGSGKTTLVRCLIRLIDPDSGQIKIHDVDFAALKSRDLRKHRKDVQIVFQDPYGSLNPRRTVGSIITEGPMNFGVSKSAAMAKARELLEIVRLDPDCVDRYPVQFSGGQRQRICIARALAIEPKVLIADESVSALDVSVQKEVLKLLADIRDEFGLTVLFITHDLRVAAQICDHLIVMKDGEVVEEGSVDEVFGYPRHPYTKALLEAEPGKNWVIPTTFETA
ncbi:MAG: ABC transporter ATP-binding protein [Alphaproteobacteria bacterium]|nr:MAG: ABC transporter ATP-binding protein [Alphaproteobacteria bacterium]